MQKLWNKKFLWKDKVGVNKKTLTKGSEPDPKSSLKKERVKYKAFNLQKYRNQKRNAKHSGMGYIKTA